MKIFYNFRVFASIATFGCGYSYKDKGNDTNVIQQETSTQCSFLNET